MDEPPPPLLDDDTLAAFTDAERTLDVNGRLFENRRSALVGTAPDVERTFFDSLVLKERLDVLEQDVNSGTVPPDAAASLFLNLEYRLYRLNEATPMHQNPFLSHWVEAYVRFNAKLRDTRRQQQLPTATITGNIADDTTRITTEAPYLGVWAARLRLVRNILSCHALSVVGQSNPRTLAASADWSAATFDVAPFIKTLRDEGIYEDQGPDGGDREGAAGRAEGGDDSLRDELSAQTYHHPSPSAHYDSAPPSSSASTSSSTTTAHPANPLLPLLAAAPSPAAAITALSRLPLDLSTLDALTRLLTSDELPRHGVDPHAAARHFLQRALRRVERMATGAPRAHASPSPRASRAQQQQQRGGGGRVGDEDPPAAAARTSPPPEDDGEESDPETLERGRDAQRRAVTLLVLFLGNLVRRGHLPPEQVYFEIQEICVRFVWIREVREFRAFLERGAA